jgi:oxaloacetate decarboxylase gamma subunit
MEDINLIFEGFKFMMLGMGTVFLFLLLMIYVLNLQTKIIHKYFPEQGKNETSSEQKPTQDNKKIVAAIVGAISAHEANK